MARILLVMITGAALFLAGAWYFGLLDDVMVTQQTTTKEPEKKAADVSKFADLYEPGKFPEIRVSTDLAGQPIVLYGAMNPLEYEEVSSPVPGRILFIGEQVDESAVVVAGSAAFLTEPYYPATIYAGRETYVKFYRRLYDGDTVRRNQMLAMIEPARAVGEVMGKIAKIGVAKADLRAAFAAEDEGDARERRAYLLWKSKSLGEEEYTGARLTKIKLHFERISAEEKLKVAEVEKDQADIELDTYAIRAKLPFERYTIKSIVRQRGAAVKPADPILVVQSLERLMAEAMIEEQYYARLKDKTQVTATIEPTIVEASQHEFPGHALDVTSVAVARDMRIVSGSEDRSVCLWKIGSLAPLKKHEHDAAVRVVACTPAADGVNLCLAGCDNGSIYLWDLDDNSHEPMKLIEKAHGNDTSITALAFSPDGKSFASGGSDGSIRIWAAADGSERYEFKPANGVAQAHEDAVTALHFTPQCWLVSAGRDKTLRVWQLKDRGAALDRKVIRDRDGSVGRLGVSHDGKWMLFDQAQARTLKLLSVETHILKHTINLPTNAQPFETFALFSPDDSLILTAGAPEGRLQLWRTPDAGVRPFEVRQFATREHQAVSCAAFSPDAGKGGPNSFAVSASGHKIYLWTIPTKDEVDHHQIKNVRMTLKTHALDSSTRQARIGFEVPNPAILPRFPDGRFEAGRPVTIVIEP